MQSPVSALPSLQAHEIAGKPQRWRPSQEDTAFRHHPACLTTLPMIGIVVWRTVTCSACCSFDG